MIGLRSLHPHQVAALDGLKSSLRSGHRRPMLHLPTGAGKTVIGAHIVAGARSKGNRVGFVVPMLSLIDQTFERFVENGIDPADMGVIQGDHEWHRPHAPIQICSAQTLARRGMPDVSVLVVDEAHIRDAKLHAYLASEESRSVTAVGLSATPWSRGLGLVYDDLVSPISMRELIGQGFLSQFRVFAPSHPDLEGVSTDAKSGDFQVGELSERMSAPTLVADIVATWLERGENRPTLCFGVDRAHASLLADQFEKSGVSTAYVDANTPREERGAIASRFKAGDVKVICNIATMTTGVDLDVRCLILARPTKSEMLFTQIIGRGLRTAPGKEDCIARDTLILTDKGEVKIQDITRAHKVWDGKNFVCHAGAVCKGVQRVITYDGLTATSDHRVMTNEGWMQIAQASRRCVRIVRTGFGGKPIRFADDCVPQDRWGQFWAARGSKMRALWRRPYGSLSQYQEEAGNGSLSALQWSTACLGSSLALSALPSPARSLSQSFVDLFQSIWRPWDRISVCGSERGSQLDCGKYWDCGSIDGNRQDQQRWPLRTGKFALGASCSKCEQQHKVGWWARAIHLISSAISGSAICRQNVKAASFGEPDERADHRKVEHAVSEAQREVWDILNAGPLQRFTANGRLVHNCLILDHSDTHLRLGMVTDLGRDELDKGKAGAGESKRKSAMPPMPRECTNCGCLVPALVKECPNCGFMAKRPSSVEMLDGDLIELGSNGRPKKAKGAQPTARDRLLEMGKRNLFAQIEHVRIHRGRSEGWAAHTYRDITSVWPRGMDGVGPQEPTPELLSFIRHKDLAWAKSKRRVAA